MNGAVVGATGAHGRRIASELARSDAVTSLLLVARSREPLERLASVLGGARRNVTSREGDARELWMGEALSGCDVVVTCAAEAHLPCATAGISAGTHCVALAEDPVTLQRLEALDGEARAKNVTVAAGCGFSPGITNLMGSFAGGRLDHVETMSVTVARSLGDAGGRSSVEALLDLYRNAAAFQEGAPADDPGHLPRLVYLPDPIGWVETFRAIHPEAASLQRSVDGIRAVEYRIGLTERRASDLARAIAALGMTRNRLTQSLWARLSSGGAVARALNAGATSWTGARIDAHGDHGERPATVTLGIVDRLGNLAPLMAARAAIELGTKGAQKAGVHPPEALFDALATLTDMSKRGVRIASLEPGEV
jgi:saccharopine dehydrogenase-like NADP-dependent oxidoreductase